MEPNQKRIKIGRIKVNIGIDNNKDIMINTVRRREVEIICLAETDILGIGIIEID